jgi:hypothetical protein
MIPIFRDGEVNHPFRWGYKSDHGSTMLLPETNRTEIAKIV